MRLDCFSEDGDICSIFCASNTNSKANSSRSTCNNNSFSFQFCLFLRVIRDMLFDNLQSLHISFFKINKSYHNQKIKKQKCKLIQIFQERQYFCGYNYKQKYTQIQILRSFARKSSMNMKLHHPIQGNYFSGEELNTSPYIIHSTNDEKIVLADIKQEDLFFSDQDEEEQGNIKFKKQLAQARALIKEEEERIKRGNQRFGWYGFEFNQGREKDDNDTDYQATEYSLEISQSLNGSGGEYFDDFDEFQVQKKTRENKKEQRLTNRKPRTTITKQKLNEMNRIFKVYLEQKNTNTLLPSINLKQICKKLELGYSTILHKFKEFKDNKQVKAGYLINNGETKRKYKKSKIVEEYIHQALIKLGESNAVEISKYIHKEYNKYYSRAVICRHMLEMRRKERSANLRFEERKDLGRNNAMRNEQKEEEQTIYEDDKKAEEEQQVKQSSIVTQAINKLTTTGDIIFLNETVFSNQQLPNNLNYDSIVRFNKSKACKYFCISTIVAIYNNQILYSKVKRGLFSRQEYINQIDVLGTKFYQETNANPEKRKILATNIHQVHYDNISEKIASSGSEDPLQTVLKKYNFKKYIIADEHQPEFLLKLHIKIQQKLNQEPINREVMKKLVDRMIREYPSNENENE